MQRTAIIISALITLANGQMMEQPTSTPTYIPVEMNATESVIQQQGGATPVNINVDPNYYQQPGYNHKPTANLPYPDVAQCYPPQQSCPPPCGTTQYPSGGYQYQYPTGGYSYPNNGYQYPSGGYQYPNNGYQYPANGCYNQYPQYQNICPTPCPSSPCGAPVPNGGYQYPSGFFGVNGNPYQNAGHAGGYNGQCGRPYYPSAPYCGSYPYGPGPYPF
jgi:hypothetical protein